MNQKSYPPPVIGSDSAYLFFRKPPIAKRQRLNQIFEAAVVAPVLPYNNWTVPNCYF